MITRLGKVLGSIINKNQATFIPNQHIQDHILIAYDLIKGYSTKGGMPSCMLQMGLQKTCDMVEWSALESILKEHSFREKNYQLGYANYHQYVLQIQN